MLESWIQCTCEGCGETEFWPFASETKRTVRAALRKAGWRSYGVLDYCPVCVLNGNAKRREGDMNN